jgi:tRNA threonylcarbamoyladenosine biosynthesis protein TsaB
LLLDAASARIQVGWLTADATTTRWAGSDEEAGVGLFRCLAELDVKPTDAGALVFCDGPGSVLGIRTAAMAVRAWRVLAPRSVHRYHSLALVAAYLDRRDVTVIADARRELWHALSLDSPLRRVRAADLAGELVTPEGFRHWAPLPPGTTTVPYSLAAMLPQLMDAELFCATDEPDAFLHEEPSYATWTPQIHRAP